MGVNPEAVGHLVPETVQLCPNLHGQGADDDRDLMGHREGWSTGQLGRLNTPLNTLKQTGIMIHLAMLILLMQDNLPSG